MIDTATRWAENIQRTLQALEADMQQADLAKARSLEEAAYINNQVGRNSKAGLFHQC